MPIAGYLGQDDLGGHTFQLDDGTTLYTPDMPEARQLAAQLGQAPDMEARNAAALSQYTNTASAPPPQPASVPDVAPSPIVVQNGPQGPQAATPYQPGMQRGAVAPAAATLQGYRDIPTLPGVAVPGGPASGQAGAPVGAPQTGLTPEEDAKVYARNPGTPGISQAQQQLRATQGTPMPASAETSGAIPANPLLEQAWANAAKDEYKARSDIAQADAAQAEAARMAAVNARIQAENQAAFAQAHQQRMEQEAQAKQSAIQQFDQEAQARYQDFGAARFFKKQGAWATIGSAIAQALGAYGAALAHTDNFAAKIIDSAIQDDIEAQRQEYLRDRDARNNLVADLARATGDVDAATEGAKAVQWNIAQAHAGELAALAKQGDVAKNWALFQPEFQQRVVDHMQRAYEKGLGNTVLHSTVVYPQAPSGGGPLTIEQLARRTHAARSIVEDRRAMAAQPGDLSPEDQAKIRVATAEQRSKYRAQREEERISNADKALGSSVTMLQQVDEWAAAQKANIDAQRTGLNPVQNYRIDKDAEAASNEMQTKFMDYLPSSEKAMLKGEKMFPTGTAWTGHAEIDAAHKAAAGRILREVNKARIAAGQPQFGSLEQLRSYKAPELPALPVEGAP